MIVLQVEGQKHWKIYESQNFLPNDRVREEVNETDPGKLIEDIVLNPGDLLYLPRGFPHVANSTGKTSSLHLTVGLNTVCWRDVLLTALDQVEKKSKFLRSGLHPNDWRDPAKLTGQLSEALMLVSDEVNGEELIGDIIRESHTLYRDAVQPGRLRDVDLLNELSPHSLISRRAGFTAHLSEHNEQVCLHFFGKTLTFPLSTRPALELVLSAKPFRAALLTTIFDSDGAKKFVETLVRAGLLTILPESRGCSPQLSTV